MTHTGRAIPAKLPSHDNALHPQGEIPPSEHRKKIVKQSYDRESLRKTALAALSIKPLQPVVRRTHVHVPDAMSQALLQQTQSRTHPEPESSSRIHPASDSGTKRVSRLSDMYGFLMQLDGATLPVDRSYSHRSAAVTNEVDQLAKKRGDTWANGCSSNDLAEMEFKAKEEEEEVNLGHLDKDPSANSNEADQSNGKVNKAATTMAEKKKRKRKGNGNGSDTAPEASDDADSSAMTISATKPKRKRKGKKETLPTGIDTNTPLQKPDILSLTAERVEQPDADSLHEGRAAIVDNVVSDPGYHADSESISQATNTV